MSITEGMEGQAREFWEFRVKNTFEQLNLHLKRRARLICVFTFHKWRVQTLRASQAYGINRQSIELKNQATYEEGLTIGTSQSL
jgi:hypothetical protein